MREDDSFTARAQEMQNAALLTAGFFLRLRTSCMESGNEVPGSFRDESVSEKGGASSVTRLGGERKDFCSREIKEHDYSTEPQALKGKDVAL